MPQPAARDRFLDLLRAAVREGTLTKLTLGKHRGADATLKNLFVRPIALKTGLHFAFVYRHATRDITKNYSSAEALTVLEPLIGADFLDAHLFTTTQNAQLETQPDGHARLKLTAANSSASAPPPGGAVSAGAQTHDRQKTHLIPVDAPWLRALGVMNDRGHAREGMADKFRQIQKFAELLTHLLGEAFPQAAALPITSASTAGSVEPATPLEIADMGSGKGYLTFAIASLLRERAHIRGVEFRPELVELCNRIARDAQFAPRLEFVAGTIASAPLERCDVLIALHACDTATDDALARGIAAGARLLVVSPCCQKELRPQLTAPPVLAGALRHGIFQERQAEFVTDALRAQLLEWAGYRTKVFEFISTEHTAKNLMIAAIKTREPAAPDSELAARVREFAAFYGIRSQALARHLGLALTA